MDEPSVAVAVAPPEASRPAPRVRVSPAAWGALAVLVVLYMVSYLDRAIFMLMVELLKHDLHITDMQFGLLAGAAFSLFYGVVGLPLGWLVDRYSRRGIIYSGVTLWSIACAFCGLARNFTGLLIGRFGLGAGEAVLLPAGLATLGDSFPRERMGMATGIFRIGAAIGSTLSIVLGGFMLAWATAHGAVTLPVVGVLRPWQQVLLLIGLPGVFMAFLAFLLPRKSRTSAGRLSDAPIWPYIVKRKAYIASVFTAGTLLFIPAYAMGVWGPAFVIRRYHLPIQEVGLLAAAGSISTIVAFPIWGWITDSLFRRGFKYSHFLPGMLAYPLMIITGYVGYILVHDVRVYFLISIINGFLVSSSAPLDAHLQITTPSALRGRIAALYAGGQTLIANSAAPAMVAFFTEKVFGDPKYVGWGLVLTYAIALPPAALALFLGRRAAERAVDEAPALPATP